MKSAYSKFGWRWEECKDLGTEQREARRDKSCKMRKARPETSFISFSSRRLLKESEHSSTIQPPFLETQSLEMYIALRRMRILSLVSQGFPSYTH